MENKYQKVDDDEINAELFGNDVRIDCIVKSNDTNDFINNFKANLESMIENAQTKGDFHAIGLKINEAIDNKYNFDYTSYQIKAGMKESKLKEKKLK